MVYTNFTEPLSSVEQELYDLYQVSPQNRSIIYVRVLNFNGTRERMVLKTKLADAAVTETCIGSVNVTSCSLLSAVAEYNIIITDGKIQFAEPPSYPKIVSLANNTAVTAHTISKFDLSYDAHSLWVRTTLAGIASVGINQYGGWMSLSPSPDPGDTPMLTAGGRSAWFLNQRIKNYLAWDASEACAPAFSDPRDDIMSHLNQLMFRTGVYTAKHYNESYLRPQLDDGLEIYYNITGTPLSPINVYEADFAYFAGAATVELFCVLCILFTFRGWWHLGRQGSFSPLEIAKVTCTRKSHYTSSVADYQLAGI